MCWWNYVMIIVRRACGGSLCRLRFGFRTVSKRCFGALCEICIAPKWFIGIYVERGHARDVTEHGSCSWYSSHCQRCLSSFAALHSRCLYGPRHIARNIYAQNTKMSGQFLQLACQHTFLATAPPHNPLRQHYVTLWETGNPLAEFILNFEFIPNLNAFILTLKFHAVAKQHISVLLKPN